MVAKRCFVFQDKSCVWASCAHYFCIHFSWILFLFWRLQVLTPHSGAEYLSAFLHWWLRMGFLFNRGKPLPSSSLEKCKPAWWFEKWFYSPGFFCLSDFRLVSREWCGRVWDHYRKWGALPMWCTVSSSSCGSCWPRMGGTTEDDGEASSACNLRRVLLEAVWFCLVSKVHKLLYCKWITQSFLEGGINDYRKQKSKSLIAPNNG